MRKTLVTALLATAIALPLGSGERKNNNPQQVYETSIPTRLQNKIEGYVSGAGLTFDKAKLSYGSIKTDSLGNTFIYDVSYNDSNFALVFNNWVLPRDTLNDAYPLTE